jgi:hypothetical protein
MDEKKPAGFHAFTVTFKARVNSIHTEVLVSEAYDPADPNATKIPHHKVKALWDTGATRSVITEETAKALGLTPTGVAQVGHAGGSSMMNTYLVNILLPNRVGIPGVQVSECKGIPNSVGALIGMDIIGRGDFSVTNADNSTVMSYRLPSVKHIDYVAESKEPLSSDKIGRNSKCPCGSGKKYKQCCGK